jgi:hypothetical protein
MPIMDSSQRSIGRLAALAAIALLALAGCAGPESRALAALPAPVFHEPPTDWISAGPGGRPATAPDSQRSVEQIEAGWRNHVVPDRAWRWIVIHHSGPSAKGNAFEFDKLHRAPPRNWDELGYHFVIGNGTGSGDGQVEVGSRWLKQKHGAHCATPSHQFNDFGVGVCLVGDFETASNRPSLAQWASLVALCRFLCREYDIRPDHILGHRDAQAAEGEVNTECPGKNMDLKALRRAVGEGKRNAE